MRSNRLLSAAELGRMRETNRALALNGRCLSSRTCTRRQRHETNRFWTATRRCKQTLKGLVKPCRLDLSASLSSLVCNPLGLDLYGDKFSSLPLPLPLTLRPAVPGRDPARPPLLPGRRGERGGCKNSSGSGRDDSLSVASTTSVSLQNRGGEKNELIETDSTDRTFAKGLRIDSI
jgi:hypothetical protein